MTQNLQNAAKAVLTGKFITIQSHLKKKKKKKEKEKSQTNNLALHLKQIEKDEQRKPKVSRSK